MTKNLFYLNQKKFIQKNLFSEDIRSQNKLNDADKNFIDNIKIENSWKEILINEFKKKYFKDLIEKVKKAYKEKIIYPPGNQIFRAFNLCKFEDIKVVILGQDPYHGVNQANGLCFSVNENVAIPPSLKNIFKEITSDLKIKAPEHGNLERWANQGVLLLNSSLTVEAKNPNSHKLLGWQEFTDAIIEIISNMKANIVFLLWGSFAIKKGSIIDKSKHLVLTSPHPSPFSANYGFLGNKHFSKTNHYLIANNCTPIKW